MQDHPTGPTALCTDDRVETTEGKRRAVTLLSSQLSEMRKDRLAECSPQAPESDKTLSWDIKIDLRVPERCLGGSLSSPSMVMFVYVHMC